MPREDPADRRNVLGGARLDAVIFCALVVLCAAVMAGLAWTRPTTVPTVIVYNQSGALSYAAPASPTSVYGATGVLTGQPIYSKDVTAVQVTYAYRFAASAKGHLAGTEQLVERVGNGQGLARTLPLQPVTAFKGRAFTTTATLHLATLQTIIASFDKVTDSGGGGQYPVSILADVTVQGRLDATPLKAAFDAPTKFTMSSAVLSLASPATSGRAASTASTTNGAGKPIGSSATGSLAQSTARSVTFFAGLTVLEGRIASLGLLAVALAVGALVGMPLLRNVTSDDERVRIDAKFGSSLVEVVSIPAPPAAVVEMVSFDGLAQVGRQLECPVLHLRTETGDEYAVVDNGTVFVYRIEGPPPQQLGRILPAGSDSPRHAVAEWDGTASEVRTS